MRHSLENFMSSIISETWKKGGGGGGVFDGDVACDRTA